MVIGAVVVHFRFWPEVTRTLDALLGQTRPPDTIVVVDDCSNDGSADAIRSEYPELELLVAPANRGCVANMNAGIEWMLARDVDAVLALTHETEMELDTVELLHRRLEQGPTVGEVAPLMGFLSHPDVVFSAGGDLDLETWRNPHVGMYDSIASWRGTGARRVPWADGACALLRSSALRDVGPLAERYWHYYDDVHLVFDLSRAGWAVECDCDAVARQQPGLLPEYYRVRNRLGFLTAAAPRRVLVRELGEYARQIAADSRRSGDGRALALAAARGVRDWATGRWGAAPQHFLHARRRDATTGGLLPELSRPQPAGKPG